MGDILAYHLNTMADTAQPNKRQLEQENAKLRADNASLRGLLLSDRLGRSFEGFFRWGGIVLVAMFIRDIGVAWAGKNTNADVDIGVIMDLLSNTSISVVIAWIFAAVCLIYGLIQQARCRSLIKRFAPAKAQAERKVDPDRTSSSLTITGTTNPSDN